MAASRNATSNASGARPLSWNNCPPAMVKVSVVCAGSSVKFCDRVDSAVRSSVSVAWPLARLTVPERVQPYPGLAGSATEKSPLRNGPAVIPAACVTAWV